MDNDTARKLFETCYMRVYSYAMTLARDKSEAEELTQETFFRAISTQRPFKGEAECFTWLCAITKRLFYNETRRKKRERALPDAEEQASGEDIQERASDEDDAFRIHRAMHELPEPYREVFELRVFGELSFRQIGAIFGKTENWARVTYHRARLKIQERVGEYEL